MMVTYDLDLRYFEAWSGARNTLDRIIEEGKCEELEIQLDIMYPEGITATELNDLLWFHPEEVFEWLDIKDEEENEDEEDE